MLSAGMLTDLASATMVRRRGFMSGSPPPFLAATVSSLMMRVKILPRLASAAPFLCLIVCHLEWPDMAETPDLTQKNDRKVYHERDRPLPRGSPTHRRAHPTGRHDSRRARPGSGTPPVRA